MTITLKDIELTFDGYCVLNKINLTIETGEFVCLLGPSGCGKTSTLRVCAGLESPASGQVIVDDIVMTDGPQVVPPERRNIGFLFQDFALFPHLSVFENVAFGLKGQSSKDIKQRVEEVLQQVRMDAYASSLPHMLSGGQQQRVALARALAPRPRIMLLDEPFSGLDSGLRAEIRDETLHVLKNNDVAAVMVTHDPEEAMFMGDRIVLMKDGNIVQAGKPADLYRHPVDHFAASFFGEINTFSGIAKNETVNSLLGDFKAPGFSDGEKVDILIRPEFIHVTDPDVALPSAQINAARYLGRDTLLHMTVANDQGESAHLHSRIDGQVVLEENQNVGISIQHERAFIFRPVP